MRYPRARWVAIVLALFVPALAACGGASSDNPTIGPAASVASQSSVPSVSSTSTAVTTGTAGTAPGGKHASSTTTAPGAFNPATTTTLATTTGSVRLAEAANGMTVQVTTGATVTVVLSNTYWMMAPAVPSTVLTQDGPTLIAPAPVSQCVPGAGCGTVTTTYTAVGAGNALVSASRTTCGEALACTGSEGSYAVKVVVTG